MSGETATPVRDPELDELTETDLPWDVIVWDDPVNLMSYVVMVLKQVLGHSDAMARKLMLEVHQRGRALVASEPREQAEAYLTALHGKGLHATMQKSS